MPTVLVDENEEVIAPSAPSRVRRGVMLALKLGLVGAILGYLFSSNNLQLSKLSNLTRQWHWLLAAVLLLVPTFFLWAVRYHLLLKTLDLAPKTLGQTFRWTMIGAFFDNLAISTGGDLVKACCVARFAGKGRRGLAFLSAALDRVVGLFALFLLALFICMVAYRQIGGYPELMTVARILVVVCLGGALGFWVLVSERLENSTLRKRLFAALPGHAKLEQLYGGLAGLRHHQGILALVLCISVFNHLLCCASILCLAQGIAFTSTVDGQAVAGLDIVPSLVVLPLALFLNVFGVAGGFGAGTIAFEKLFALLLCVNEGAELATAFHVVLLATRLLGAPFVLFQQTRPAAKPAQTSASPVLQRTEAEAEVSNV